MTRVLDWSLEVCLEAPDQSPLIPDWYPMTLKFLWEWAALGLGEKRTVPGLALYRVIVFRVT